MKLTEFLLARIAEDEAVAREAGTVRADLLPDGREAYADPNDVEVRMRPGRVLAECEAKRRIVDLHEPDWYHWRSSVLHCSVCAGWADADYDGPPIVPWPCDTLRLLALPYAEHPDYREEWRP